MIRFTSPSELDILRRVSAIVADVLDYDSLTLEPSMTAADVDGWDSVAHIQILVAVEKAFNLRFRTGELGTAPNVGALVHRIATRLERKDSSH